MEKLKTIVKFKKDYVTALAMFLFLLMVAAELALAIWIPLHLRSEKVWVREAALQNMLDTFDHVRSKANRFKTRNEWLEGEVGLIAVDLNDTARYLRQHHQAMTLPQINALHAYFKDYRKYMELAKKSKKPLSKAKKLKAGKYIKNLLNKSHIYIANQQKKIQE